MRAVGPGANRIRLVIADDHPLVLKGIREFLSSHDDIEVVEACNDGEQALSAIRQQCPDMAVLDLSMPRMNGREVLESLEQEHSTTRVLFLGGAPAASDVIAAMAHGAFAFLSKDCQPDELVSAIRRAAAGQRTYPFELANGTDSNDGGAALEQVLTPTEWKVVAYAAQGLSNKEIARRLGIATGTTKTHLHHVFQKLGVKNRTALASLSLNAVIGGR